MKQQNKTYFFTMQTNSRINVSLTVVSKRVSNSDPGTERE